MKIFLPYFVIIFLLCTISYFTRIFIVSNPHVIEEIDFQLFIFGGIFFIGYVINYLAPKTIIPSFVWAIFAGMAMQPVLGFYTHRMDGFKVAMEVIAAFILFYGGLEVPFNNFKKWFLPIVWLSFFGLILSSIFFAAVIMIILTFFGIPYDGLLISIVILSASLASTDPTAIIPMLKIMHFKRPYLKDIAITESALTDVSGSIVTRFLLLAFISSQVVRGGNLLTYFSPLWQRVAYERLSLQIITAVVVGYIGFAILHKFYSVTKNSESENDPALLLSVPLFTFVLGNIIGGAGFLASFVAGLISEVSGGLKNVSPFYSSLIDHLLKPFIFISLGGLVPIDALIQYAPLGILSGLLFMFVVRPFVVFCSLFPWMISGTFRFADLLFLSLVRETGIIAAILVVISASFEIISSDFVIAIGMWVILCTLVIEPPITPYLARKIGVAK